VHKWLTASDIMEIQRCPSLGGPQDRAQARLIADRREMRELFERLACRRVSQDEVIAIWNDIRAMLEATADA